MAGPDPTRTLPQRPPEVGELVQVRSRRWLVEEVQPPARPGGASLVTLACATDDAQGESLQVFWDYELDRRILAEEDTTSAEHLVRRFADRFWKDEWPGNARPRVFYDPRSVDPHDAGVLHAKAVVADNEAVFVTSANLTEAALDHNIEVGLLVRDRTLAASVTTHFTTLIDRSLLRPLRREPPLLSWGRRDLTRTPHVEARGVAGPRPEAVRSTAMDRRLLTRVVLRNYKSIAACDVEPAQLSFLVGPNGSGKSNFLDALRFIADSLRFSIDHALRDRGGINEVRRRSGGHPTHFGIRLEFNLEDSQGHYTFRVGAKAGGGYDVQREECRVFRRSVRPLFQASSDEHHYYRVESGRVVRSTVSPPPAAAADRLYLVNVSGVDAFRPVYDALSGAGFYNLSPDVIRDLQPTDPGELLKRDGSNAASCAVQPRDSISRFQEADRESYLGKVVPGVAGVDRRPVGPRETLEFRQEVRGAEHLGSWRFFREQHVGSGTLRAFGVLLALFDLGRRAGGGRSTRCGGTWPTCWRSPGVAADTRGGIVWSSGAGGSPPQSSARARGTPADHPAPRRRRR